MLMLKLQFVTASRNAITSITNNSSRDLKKKKKGKICFTGIITSVL